MRLSWWVALAAVVCLLVVAAGCVTVEERAFVLRHAEKVEQYVATVDVGPLAVARQEVEESDRSPDEKAAMRATLAEIGRRGQDLLEDAATIRRIWGP